MAALFSGRDMAHQVHDEYGKKILRLAAGSVLRDSGWAVEVDYGTKSSPRIDGAAGEIAIEVESRTSKQVRGAVLDLIVHPCSRKLLVLLPVHMANARLCADQCRHALSKFIFPELFRVVVASGHGHNPCVDRDTELVREALKDLGLDIAV